MSAFIIRVPEIVFKTRVRDESIKGENPYKWKDKTTDDYFKNIRAILFSLPGISANICFSAFNASTT